MQQIFRFIYKQDITLMIFFSLALVILWQFIMLALKKHYTFSRIINIALLSFSVGVILFETLARNGNVFDVQLIPFHFLIEAKIQSEMYRSVFMNALLFVPVGLFMPFAIAGKRGRYAVPITVLFSAVLSATIEFLQYRFHLGRCETDDVIFNTLGAAVGSISYVLYIHIIKIWEKRSFMLSTITDSQKLLLRLCGKSLFNKDFPLPADFDAKSLISEAKNQTVFTNIYPLIKDNCDLADNNIFSQMVAKNMRVEHGHYEVHRILSENNIPYVILKGVASASYYKEPLLRTMGDVDVLVSPKDILKADTLLRSIGFSSDDDVCGGGIHIGYTRTDGVSCELHRAVNGIPKNDVGEIVKKHFDNIFEKVGEYKTANGSCFLPDKFHHGLILLLHTISHLTHEGVGLRHLLDWLAFAESFDDAQFCATFEAPLKTMGIWDFARTLTFIGVSYLGATPKQWTDGVDPALAEDLLCDILNGGNFGKKDLDRYNQIKLISNRATNTVGNKSTALQLLASINQKAKAEYAFSKHIILLPVGWLCVVAKYIWYLFIGKRRLGNIKKTFSSASERKGIYQQLNIFELKK